MLGGFAHLIGADAFRLLIGGDLDHFAGAGEGVVIGAALPQVVLSGYGVFHVGEIK